MERPRVRRARPLLGREADLDESAATSAASATPLVWAIRGARRVGWCGRESRSNRRGDARRDPDGCWRGPRDRGDAARPVPFPRAHQEWPELLAPQGVMILALRRGPCGRFHNLEPCAVSDVTPRGHLINE